MLPEWLRLNCADMALHIHTCMHTCIHTYIHIAGQEQKDVTRVIESKLRRGGIYDFMVSNPCMCGKWKTFDVLQ
jgi:hypothetical protein